MVVLVQGVSLRLVEEMLRVSLMATHDESMLQRALEVFARARTATWPAAVQ